MLRFWLVRGIGERGSEDDEEGELEDELFSEPDWEAESELEEGSLSSVEAEAEEDPDVEGPLLLLEEDEDSISLLSAWLL